MKTSMLCLFWLMLTSAIGLAQSRFLTFPLRKWTPATAKINSVFDHSMSLQYHPDDVVISYSGEEGRREFGASTFFVNFGHGDLQGFKKADGGAFLLNGHYSGGGEPEFLFYDGHPGYDYRTKDSEQDPISGKADVFAAASGTVVCVSLRRADGADIDREENVGDCAEGGTAGEIKIDHGNGFFTIYLHLSSATVHAGDQVSRGQKIGISGETGTQGAPHLHFEVRKNVDGVLVPVDPYGWERTTPDPYISAYNFNLWLNTSRKMTQEVKLTATDGIAGHEFGRDASISGDYVIVGASGDNDRGLISGAAYVFKRDGEDWSQHTKLIASDGEALDIFGRRVSMSGDFAIVSAWGDDDNGTNSGSAYIFKRDGENWTEQSKLTASDGTAGAEFGVSVAISGDFAIVGSINSGSVYVFKRDGENWTEQSKLTASDGATGDNFGVSISISGDYIIVGAQDDDDNGTNSGSAYIFKRDGENWTEQSKLTASDGAREDLFGGHVSIDGYHAVVGASLDDDNGSSSGSAYIFKRDGENWTEQGKLTASDGAAGDVFGVDVSISGDYIIVGASGGDDNGSGSGSAYIFKRDGGQWTEQIKLTASDGAAGDIFGTAVSISGDHVLVTAEGDDDNGTNSGAVYLYSGFIVFSPLVSNPIMDQFVSEDFSSYTVANLDTVFHDIDTSTLSYSAQSDGNTNAAVDEGRLVLSSVPNFNGTSIVIVSATDDHPVTARDTFHVVVQAVNDPPSTFGLLSPSNATTLSNLKDPIEFLWYSSLDVDRDVLTYTLWLSGGSLDTTKSGIQDTLFTFDGSGLLEENTHFRWSSSVTDGMVTVASPDTFEFQSPAPTGIAKPDLNKPENFFLHYNYPNPFNPQTSIGYDLPKNAHVTLGIYNILGQRVRMLVDMQRPAGRYIVTWNGMDELGRHLPSGVYVYRIRAGSFEDVKKMILLR